MYKQLIGRAILYDQRASGWSELGGRRERVGSRYGRVLWRQVVAGNAGWKSRIGERDVTMSLGEKWSRAQKAVDQ